MHRFFVAPQAINGDQAIITGEDVQHISRVLRLGPGSEVTLCDGAKQEYAARIVSVEPNQVVFNVISASLSQREPRCAVTLYQGMPKAGKLETIIQKCVELGVSRIVPVDAGRSVAKPEEKDFLKKLPRYQRVAYEAAKQSRRGVIPEVMGLTRLQNVDFSQYDLILLAYEDENKTTLKETLRKHGGASNIALIVGPEGGFASEEVEMLSGVGAISVSLGPRILRTETAGMAMLAMTLYELEM